MLTASTIFGCEENDVEIVEVDDFNVEISFCIEAIDDEIISACVITDFCNDGARNQVVEGGASGTNFYRRIGNLIVGEENEISVRAVTIAIGDSDELGEEDNTSIYGTAIRVINQTATEDFYLSLLLEYDNTLYTTFEFSELDYSISILDSQREATLQMSLSEENTCNGRSIIARTNWTYSGYAYSTMNNQDSIYLRDVNVHLQNGSY
jgi:hypothetical protein